MKRMVAVEVRDDHPPLFVILAHEVVGHVFEQAGADHGLICSTLIHMPGLSP